MTDATDDQDAVLGLLDTTRAVLFDFDGPVCDLFGGASTACVAERIKQVARQDWEPLDRQVETCDDSHGILRRLRDMYDRRAPEQLGRRPLVRAEKIVADFESEAVRTARASEHINPLVGLLLELPMRLVIVSNNAEGPIRQHLERQGLDLKFERVFGRDPENAGHMKPDPHCVKRALRHLRLAPSSCLVVGDQLTDLKAAWSVGVPFLGYTQDEKRYREMKDNGANAVVSSHATVVEAAKELIKIRRASASDSR
ncbi:HAD family hydrolase [Streptomyces sp. NBC_00076]|uniref:HAD family hydrolase n=1 Tax=Streptomyces sp. NBC_00076 TaxID=2975642 RepID=UPI00324AB20D